MEPLAEPLVEGGGSADALPDGAGRGDGRHRVAGAASGSAGVGGKGAPLERLGAGGATLAWSQVAAGSLAGTTPARRTGDLGAPFNKADVGISIRLEKVAQLRLGARAPEVARVVGDAEPPGGLVEADMLEAGGGDEAGVFGRDHPDLHHPGQDEVGVPEGLGGSGRHRVCARAGSLGQFLAKEADSAVARPPAQPRGDARPPGLTARQRGAEGAE